MSAIEDFYQNHKVGISENISALGRNISKKIFGTGISVIRENSEFKYHIPANLSAFAHILLLIAFKDEYIMSLLIDEIKSSDDVLKKLKNLPFGEL